jgi:hypothetical protein
LGVLAPAGIAATVGLAAAKALHTYALARDERAESSGSYVLELQRFPTYVVLLFLDLAGSWR